MRANKLEDSPQYQRILELLTDYWTSEPDEAYVEVDMKFVHANGEWLAEIQEGRNPYRKNGDYYTEDGERLYTRDEVRRVIDGTVRDVHYGFHDPGDILIEDFVR